MWWRLTLGEWRLHWRLYSWLVAGLIVAAALTSGIQVLIAAADQQFSHAQAIEKQQPGYRIRALIPGYHIDYRLWTSIRQQGITAEPVIIGRVKLASGDWLPVRGVSAPFAALDNGWRTLVSEQLAKRFHWQPLLQPKLATGTQLPPLQFSTTGGGWLTMDIAPAMALLESDSKVSFLRIPQLTQQQLQWLQNNIPGQLQLISDDKRVQQQQPMYDAFMMNLTALASLSFVVALFLAFHALVGIVDARKQRQTALNYLGASLSAIRTWNLTEALLLAVISGFIGSIIGVYLAAYLSGGFELTLTALYQLDQPLTIGWKIHYGLYCSGLLLMSVVAMALLPRVKAKPVPLLLVNLAAVTITAVVIWASNSHQAALVLCALTLLLAIITIPMVISVVITAMSLRSSKLTLLWRWGIADLHQYKQGLMTALIAVALSLAMAISTRVLVGSFEIALTQHLEQRLFADLYLRGTDSQLRLWQSHLGANGAFYDMKALSQRRGTLAEQPIIIKAIETQQAPDNVYHFKSQIAQWWQALTQGGCIVNEPLALKNDLGVGQTIEINSGARTASCRIAAIYFDYGNPNGEVTFELGNAKQRFGTMPLRGLGLATDLEQVQISAELERLAVPVGAVFWQQSIVTTAKSLFKKTFMITDALASLTLLVALVSWFASLMAQRQRNAAVNELWLNLGLAPSRLSWVRAGQLALLMLIAVAIAIVLGLILGWLLLAIVNPLSFGWSMAMVPLSGSWYLWLLVTLIATAAIGLLPTKTMPLARGESI